MTENETIEQKENLELIGTKVKPFIRETIEDIAKENDHSISKTVARLLESHPQIVEKLQNQPEKLAA